MAFKIIGTTQGVKGFEKTINYLEENWSGREVSNFMTEAGRFFETLVIQPEILQKTGARKNTYRGPINSLTIITYRIKPKKERN